MDTLTGPDPGDDGPVTTALRETHEEVGIRPEDVDVLLDGSCAFGGEESAGASFLRHDGTVWTTDKDGIILALLASSGVEVSVHLIVDLRHLRPESEQPIDQFGPSVSQLLSSKLPSDQSSMNSRS